MDPFTTVLIGLAALIGIALAAAIRSGRTKSKASAAVESALARLDARIDEQGRRHTADAQALRSEIEQRLASGFERTTQTHSDIVKRLALIDRAQERIAELSANVVSLREILADRSARGAFGEVQLQALVTNVLPPGGFAMQHTLSNGKRADCMLFLPPPTGNIAIDSKFPLSNFRRKVDPSLPQSERLRAGKDFARDVRTHVDAVASKYIVPGETCDAAVLFVPAEAVFAEIHASYPEVVEAAQRQSVWLTSPTTLMAVLTTARAVFRGEAARREVHAIQEHLRALGEDFGRFEANIGKLDARIRHAGDDVSRIASAARRIANRFKKIDRLDMETEPAAARTPGGGNRPAGAIDPARAPAEPSAPARQAPT